MDAAGSNAAREQRSNSVSSAGSGSSPRRASAGAGLFASLHEQKRSNDPIQQARRQSLNEQRPQQGFLGKMWNNWLQGSNPPSK